MENNILCQQFLRELEGEAAASRKCIERMDEKFFDYKPHEKSMPMGYLAVLVAEIPKWITITLEQGEIDFATWQRYQLTSVAELVKYFDENMEKAKAVLAKASDEDLMGDFVLKHGEKELMRDNKRDSLSGDLRHWVHHRGQLTVYMRLNNIPVPSIYGPSADEQTF
jgi:uncharacterized damage-inducible protein DinB